MGIQSQSITILVDALLNRATKERDQATADKAISELNILKNLDTESLSAEALRLGRIEGKLSVFEWILPALETLDGAVDSRLLGKEESIDMILSSHVDGIRTQVRRLHGLDEGIHNVTDFLETLLDRLNGYIDGLDLKDDLKRWRPDLSKLSNREMGIEEEAEDE